MAGLAVAVTWLLMALGLRISSLSALIAVALAPFFFWLTGHGAYAPVVALLALLVIVMHHANIRRLLNGTEPRIGSKGHSASSSEAIGRNKSAR
jgi:glycerol-3-phosphate acyltransferase PlsY